MKYIFIRSAIFILIILIILAANPLAVVAWDQAPNNQTHQAINSEAVDRFLQMASKSDKYKNSTIDLGKVYTGPQVVSYGNYVSTYHLDSTRALTFKEWLIHGGYSADEPHLYASVRHFYNPLPEVGPPQLTDHSEAWDTVGNAIGLELHAISARDWAFTNDENSFCWKNALGYYKQAMEISDDRRLAEVPGTSFRDQTIPVGSPDAARNIYLAKAFRGLGETMHLIADMTQPAHVRNDSHPVDEPLEASVSKSNVLLARYFQPEPEISNQIDSSSYAEDIFVKVALFTNKNFYSSDTIFDKASGINPRNGEFHFPFPQFKDLVPLTSKTTPAGVPISGSAYGKYFKNTYFENSNLIPMIQQNYSSYILGQKGFHVPYSFGLEQSAVLLPIAIKANARLIDLFFPTMELTLGVTKSQISNQNYQEFTLTSQMRHLIEKDENWRMQGVGAIRYCGPAELWSERSGKIADKIQFEGGTLKRQLILYTGKLPDTSASAMAADKYRIQDGDSVYMVIRAGGRIFKSDVCQIASTSVPNQLPPSPALPDQPAAQPASDSCDFTGQWETSPGSYFGTLIIMTGNGGTYNYNNGKITGSAVGCKFIGSWHEDHRKGRPSDEGPLEFIMSEDGEKIDIFWGWAGETPTRGGSARRIK